MAATWWDQFLLLVVQTDGAAASLDLEDTSATDVYLPLIMDSQIASVSGYFYFRLLIFEIYRKLGPGNNIERLDRKDKERVRSMLPVIPAHCIFMLLSMKMINLQK